MMTFAPHASIAEWEAAAAAAPVERALHGLGLRPIRDWPLVEFDHRGGTEVGDLQIDPVYQVMSWPVPVAIATTDPTGPGGHLSLLWNLATGLTWKLGHIKEVFTTAAAASGLTSLRIVFAHHDTETGPPLTAANVGDGVLTIGWNMRAQDALVEDSFAVERILGEVVSQCLVAEVREEFVSAWTAAPPGIRIDAVHVRQRAQWLPDPLEPHDAVRSDILRRLGEHMASTDIEPGTREGQAATQFESGTVFPWLLKAFHENVSGLAGDELLTFALAQLERVHRAQLTFERKIGWQRGFPVRGQGDGSKKREHLTRMVRVISFIVEEVLAHPPGGDGRVDDLAWIDAISFAELCIESCHRSDALHHQLTRASVNLTNMYEVRIQASDEPTDVNITAYYELRARLTMPRGVPIGTGLSREPDDEGRPRAVLEQLPELAPIDTEMRGTLGFGIDALTGVLNIAAQWESATATSATLVSSQDIVDECVELAVGAARDEYAAALDWLTLRDEDLQGNTIPHWETERRAKRIATSPFVATASGSWILPWTAEHTLRIITNYLSDGRLPWPAKALPDKVNKALNKYRQQQNRDAEKDCVAALTDGNLVLRPVVTARKAAKIGISQLSGEIDVLCLDPDRSRIWVIEVKDSYTPYSSYQIRNLVKAFNDEGKYVDKLLTKVREVAACASPLATALAVPDPGRDWIARGLIVTRNPEPVAFTANPRVAYCLLADVLDVVTSEELGEPGLQGTTATTGASR